MDIHKPKPIHGWRELFKEIGIIVIGVSIALSAEQGVERWRQHQQYREARQAMIDELSANLTNIRMRQKYIACTIQRMQDVDAILDRADGGQPFEAAGWIGPALGFRMRFMAEGEAQKSSLFSSAEQRNFGSLYSYFHSLEGAQDREREAWGRLRMLEGKSRLSPAMSQSLQDALADARNQNYRITFLLKWTAAWGKLVGLKDFPRANVYAKIVNPHCLPVNMPAAQAEKESNLEPNF
jgi:hypothetical protein